MSEFCSQDHTPNTNTIPGASVIAVHHPIRTTINTTPEDALISIFQYCDPKSLQSVELVTSRWRNLIYTFDREIWTHHVELLWTLTLNKPSSINVKERIKELPLSKLKKSLRAIDLTRCVEKSDFQNMLLAKLLFSRVMERELHGDDIRFRGKYMTMYYPEWSLQIAVMKASYFYAKLQLERKYLYASELCSISWTFRFKENAFEDMQGESPSWKTKFSEDGSMYSQMNDHHYQWKFVTEANSEKCYVQVDNYPPLSCTKLADGTWRMENNYVYFLQDSPLAPDQVPLLDSV